jgi:polyphenol oxidase
MQKIDNNPAPYLVFDGLSGFNELQHFVTMRHGGVSQGPYSSLNIGLGTDDDPAHVLQNRRNISQSVGIPLELFVMQNQVHGTHVAVVTSEMKGQGAFDRHTAIQETDAMVTNERGICLFVMSADCVPLLFFDPVHKVIGACHAGWRGTVDKAPLATLEAMNKAFGSRSQDIYAGIGPSIGSCCYHVGGEVIDMILRNFGTTDSLVRFDTDGQPYLDLWATNQHTLTEAGVPVKQIEIAGLCTRCHHTDFFSSRNDKGLTERFGAGIMLK